jgi:hypothetical protein
VYGTPVRGIGNYLAEFFSPDPNIGPWSLFTRRIFSFADRFVAHYFYGTRAVSIGLLIEIGAALIIGFLMALKKEYVVRTLHDLALYPLLAGTVLHISHYKLLGYLAPKAWYWIVEMFVLVLLVTIFMEVVYRLIYDTEIKLLKWIPRFLVILGVGFILKPHLEYIAHAFRKLERVESQYYLRKTDWLEDHTEAEALIGMTGAGSTSYFVNDRTIINLDGLVNGKTYFEHLRKGKIIEYLQDVGVDYIFGNSYLIKEREPYQSSLGVYLDDGANPVFNDQLTLWDLEK